ncbi:MAG TPA: ABC transporter ATP-binding protein [Sulfolobales archaeon]|nr:ABC transporter ATP-binding protein [Sulfolobales archaeon]
MEKILVVEGLTKRFGELVAVDNVSFEIGRGEVVGLIGPNGSGKTTLFNLITGVLRPDSGRIFFEGKRIDGMPPHKIYSLGLVRSFQIPRVFDKVTVAENAMLSPRGQVGESPLKAFFKSIWARQEVSLAERVASILEDLQLLNVHRSRSSAISGGQMKLTEMARVMASSPKMIFLDEPAAGVAISLAHEIFRRLRSLRDEAGITLFIIEHRLDILLEYVDRVMVMSQGRIIADGKPREVIEDPRVVEVYLGEWRG